MLEAGHQVIYLLRSPSAFNNDPTLQSYIKSGQAQVVKGDALSKPDIQNAWDAAGDMDLVLFTVGGTPTFHLTKGFVISPPNLTTQALSNVLTTVAEKGKDGVRVVAVTSTGVTKASHDALPFGFKTFYSYALHSPHVDKLGMERLLQSAMGRTWSEGVEPQEEILPKGWEKNYPAEGWLRDRVVIVRPALLTDGDEKRDYKVSDEEFGSYTISRRDVGHFIGARLTRDEWNSWKGKIVNVGN